MSGPLRVLTLLAAVIGIAACDADRPTAPGEAPNAAELSGIALKLTVDLRTGTVVMAPAAPSGDRARGLSFALLGRNEVEAVTSNFTRSAIDKKKDRIRFDVVLRNQLQGVNLVTPTFPQPPLGQQSLMLFPYLIDRIVGKGEVAPSTDWDGDGTPGGGAPFNFFNDPKCSAKPSGCFRWKGFPSPLASGATSPARTIGFDVDVGVQTFEVYLVLAADVQNPGSQNPGGQNPGTITGTVTSPERGALANVVVTLNPGGQTTTTDSHGRYSFASLVLGTVTLTLDNLPASCSAPGPKSVAVTAGVATTVDFEVRCGLDQIAFVANIDGLNQIFVMNADGTGRRQISDGTTSDDAPAWSPDGSKIAFVSGILNQIYVMNADGTGRKRISDSTSIDMHPAWSPDGSRIAFDSEGSSAEKIYVMNADGTGRRKLSEGTSRDIQPAWSPDGSKIAFVDFKELWTSEIYVMNADGTGRIRISSSLPIPVDYAPAWSPDGSKIAFVSRTFGFPERIFVMNADGTGRMLISDNTAQDTEPAWSPDGSRIAFTSIIDGISQIFVMNADGTGRRNLNAEGYTPRWKP